MTDGVGPSEGPGIEEAAGRAQPMADEQLYQELRRRAGRLMQAQPRDHTLQATALVNEAFLRLADLDAAQRERDHMLAIASRAMRHVLVDHARSRSRERRTPGGVRVDLDEAVVSYEERGHDLLALDEAIERLAAFDEVMARAVELRFFGGLPVEETARILEIPKRTLERKWVATRAWLLAELK